MLTLEKFERLQEQIKYLEKRCANMSREIELKDIQIKSQEQMISRRNKELEEYRLKVPSSDLENSEHSQKVQDIIKEKLQALEIKNENLMKDNVLLFQNNKYLSEQLKQGSSVNNGNTGNSGNSGNNTQNSNSPIKQNYIFEDFENKDNFLKGNNNNNK